MNFCRAVVVGCACLVSMCAARLLWVAGDAVQSIPRVVDNRLASIQSDADARLDAIVAVVEAQVSGARRDAFMAAGNVTAITDKRTGDALAVIRDAVNKADTQLTSINSTASSVQATMATAIGPIQHAAEQVDKVIPDFLDCQESPDGIGNKSCIQVRYNDLSSSADRTMSAIAKSAPAMADHVEKIAASSERTANAVAETGEQVSIAAKRFNQPQSKMQQLKSWMLTIARIYGAL